MPSANLDLVRSIIAAAAGTEPRTLRAADAQAVGRDEDGRSNLRALRPPRLAEFTGLMSSDEC
jgi:hypothetical protein